MGRAVIRRPISKWMQSFKIDGARWLSGIDFDLARAFVAVFVGEEKNDAPEFKQRSKKNDRSGGNGVKTRTVKVLA